MDIIAKRFLRQVHFDRSNILAKSGNNPIESFYMKSHFLKLFCFSVLLVPLCSYPSQDLSTTDTIFDAVRQEDLTQIRQFVQSGTSLEDRDEKGLTPLLFAVGVNANEETILELLHQGADIESVDPAGNTPLLLACVLSGTLNRGPLVQALISSGADIEALNSKGNTPLIEAANNNNIDSLQHLLNSGANLESLNNNNQSALIVSTDSNNVAVVQKLLKAGANPNATDESGMTPLMYAAFRGNLAITNLLIEFEAEVNLATWRSVSIVTKKKSNALDSLLEEYFGRKDPETVVPEGATALTFAKYFGGRGAERILLKAGGFDPISDTDTSEKPETYWYEI